MALSWPKRWVKSRFSSRGQKTSRMARPHRRSTQLNVEALEDRTLLTGGLGNISLGLREAALAYDINSQWHDWNNQGLNTAQQNRALGYLFGDVGSLVGAAVGAIPGVDTKTLGQAMSLAGDISHLVSFLATHGATPLGTPAGIALQDVQQARADLQRAEPNNPSDPLAKQAYSLASKVKDWASGYHVDGIPDNPRPSAAVSAGLWGMATRTLDAAAHPNQWHYGYQEELIYNSSTGTYTDDATDRAAVKDGLPINWRGLTEAFADALAVAGDISALTGGPIGGIVSDALATAHDALAVGLDLTGGQNAVSDLGSLGADTLTLINDVIPAPKPSSQPLSVSVSVPNGPSAAQAGTIATFSDPNVAANQAAPPASAYTAYISWGDGSSSFGQVAAGNGGGANYTVTGNHVYTTAANYSVNVVVAGNGVQGQGAQTVTINSSAGASQQTQGITVAGQSLTTQGSQSVNGAVATVYAPKTGSYSATIDWGDGATSTGQVVANPNGAFNVTGSHTYSQGGSYATHVLVSDANGNLSSAFGSVATASPTSSVNPLPAVETSPSFTVSWSGSDLGGPGIVSYDVYFSDNGGPWTAGLTATTLTASTFTGYAGHSYRFYSVATDGLGITQPTRSAEAFTVVQLPPQPSDNNTSSTNNTANTMTNNGNPFAQEIEQILGLVETEIHQILNTVMAIVQEIQTVINSVLHPAPKVP
jgi:hypothetical protein